MAILQRLILALGIIAALTVTFVLPPKIIQGMNGARVSIAGACGAKYESIPNENPFRDPVQKLRPEYEACAANATINTSLLATYLGVIVASTVVLAYAVRPRS